ncbi:MAG TPA: shikimate kinase [Acidobacteriaceae bacterium]
MSSIPSNSRGAGAPLPQSVERVVLTGFMGSGKSTIGRSVAEQLGWRFVDLDSAIELRDGRTVARIFSESGEEAFRALETDVLAASLHERHIVLALGGGALETPVNRILLASAPHTGIVLLTAGFDTLYDRCLQQVAVSTSPLPVRPLLGDRETAAARLARRDATYRESAHVILDTTGQQPPETLNTLLRLLQDIL